MSISKNSTNSAKFINTRKTSFQVFLEIYEFEIVYYFPKHPLRCYSSFAHRTVEIHLFFC